MMTAWDKTWTARKFGVSRDEAVRWLNETRPTKHHLARTDPAVINIIKLRIQVKKDLKKAEKENG